MRDELAKLIEEAKTNNANIKKYNDLLKNSKENLEDDIQDLEHKLITEDLSKER